MRETIRPDECVDRVLEMMKIYRLAGELLTCIGCAPWWISATASHPATGRKLLSLRSAMWAATLPTPFALPLWRQAVRGAALGTSVLSGVGGSASACARPLLMRELISRPCDPDRGLDRRALPQITQMLDMRRLCTRVGRGGATTA
jgi:hypothetical protein